MKTLFRIWVLSTLLALGLSHPYNYYQSPGYYHQQWRHQPDTRTQYLPPDHEWSMRSYPLPGQPYPAPDVVNYQQDQSYPVYPDAFPSARANAPVYPVQETSHSHIIKKVLVPATRGSQIIDLSPDGDEQDVKIIQVKPKNDGSYDDSGLPDVVKEALMRFLANDKYGHNNQTSPAFTIIAHEDAIAQHPASKSKPVVRPKPVHHYNMIHEQHLGRRPIAQNPKTDTNPVNKADKITVVATGDDVKAVAVGDNIEAIATGKNPEAVAVSSNAKAKAVVDGKPDNSYLTPRVTKHPLQTTPTSFDKPTPVHVHKPVTTYPSHNLTPILKHIPFNPNSDKPIPVADDCYSSDAKTTAKEVKPTPAPTLTPTPVPVHKQEPTHATKPTTTPIVDQKATTVKHVPVTHKSDKPIPGADNYNYPDDIIAPTKEVKPTPETTFKPTPVLVNKHVPTYASKHIPTPVVEHKPTTDKHIPINSKPDKPISGADDHNSPDDTITPDKDVNQMPEPTLKPTPVSVNKHVPTHASKPTLTPVNDIVNYTLVNNKFDKPVDNSSDSSDDSTLPDKAVTHKTTHLAVGQHSTTPTVLNDTSTSLPVADDYNSPKDTTSHAKEIKQTPGPDLKPTLVPVHKHVPTHDSQATITLVVEHKPTPVKHTPINPTSDKSIPQTDDSDSSNDATSPDEAVKPIPSPDHTPKPYPIQSHKPTYQPSHKHTQKPTLRPVEENSSTTIVHDTPTSLPDDYGSPEVTTSPSKEEKELKEPTLKPTAIPVHKLVPTSAAKPTVAPVVEHKPTHTDHIVNDMPIHPKPDKSKPVDDDCDSYDKTTLLAIEVKPTTKPTPKTTSAPVHKHAPTHGPKPTLSPAEEPNPTVTSKPEKPTDVTTSPDETVKYTPEPDHKSKTDSVTHKPTHATKPTPNSKTPADTPKTDPPAIPKSDRTTPTTDGLNTSTTEKSKPAPTVKPTRTSTEIYKPAPVDSTEPDISQTTSTTTKRSPTSVDSDMDTFDDTYPKSDKDNDSKDFVIICSNPFIPMDDCADQLIKVIREEPNHFTTPVDKDNKDSVPDHSCVDDKINNDEIDDSKKIIKNDAADTKEVKIEKDFDEKTSNTEVRKLTDAFNPINKTNTEDGADDEQKSVLDKKSRGTNTVKDETITNDIGKSDTTGDNLKESDSNELNSEKHVDVAITTQLEETNKEVKHKETKAIDTTDNNFKKSDSNELNSEKHVDVAITSQLEKTNKEVKHKDTKTIDTTDNNFKKSDSNELNSEKHVDVAITSQLEKTNKEVKHKDTKTIDTTDNNFKKSDSNELNSEKHVDVAITSQLEKTNKEVKHKDTKTIDTTDNNFKKSDSNELNSEKHVDVAITSQLEKTNKEVKHKDTKTIDTTDNNFKKSDSNELNSEKHVDVAITSQLEETNKEVKYKDTKTIDTTDENFKKSDSNELNSEKHVDVAITSLLEKTNKEVKHKETKTIDTDDECDQEASVSHDTLQSKSEETAKNELAFKDLEQKEIGLSDKDDKISKTEPTNLIAYILSLIKNVLSNDDALKEIVNDPDVQKTVKCVLH